MAGIIGLRAEDMEQVDALQRAKLDWPHGAPMVRPSVKMPILVDRGGKVEAISARFGFSRKFSSINARSEKLLESPMWRRFFGKSHGLVPISYVIEWVEKGSEKTPYLIGRADGRLTMAPALVGHHFESKEDAAFAICTIPPNGFFSRFHDRMVAACPDDLRDRWLKPEGESVEDLVRCLGSPPDDSMAAVPTSSDITKRKAGNWSGLEPAGAPLRWKDVKDRPVHKGPDA